MPASSDGGQGLQNQGGNYQNVNINNQTQRQRRPVELSFPIQEGFQGGQATINDETESDAGSLLYDNNFAGIQATPSFQQPALSENTRGHSLPSTSPVQSASGFSGVSMNIPSGGHLRPLQSYNEELVAIDVDLQSLKRKLKQELGDTYETIVANCVSTFNGTTLNDANISKCSSQLLYYVGDNALKCKNCKQTGNIGTIFRHEEWCIVGICSQRCQDVRHSNLPNRTEGDINILVLPFNRRQDGELQDRAASGQTYGATGGVLQAGVPQSPMLPFNRRQEGELQDRAASGQTYVATGGVLQAGGPQSSVLPFNRRQEGELQDRAASGQTYVATGGVLQAGGPQSSVLPFNRRQEGELQDRAASGQTYVATGGVLQAGGPQSEEISYKADNYQTCSESGYTTAPGPPPNQTAQNVHLTPGGSTNEFDQNRNQGPYLPPSLPNSTEGHVTVQMKLLALDRRQEGELQDREPTNGAPGGALQVGALLSEKASYKAAILPRGSSNGFDQNRNQGPCLPPSLPNSTEGQVNVQMKLLALDRRQEGGLHDRGPTDGATGGALQAGALLSEETSYKAAILPNEDTRKLLLEMGFKEDKIHRAQQIFKNRKSNMEWTVPDFLDILDNEIHQENVMDPSICGVCHERKAAASQFECRHVVCLDCAPKKYADCCKICNRPVVKVVAIDL